MSEIPCDLLVDIEEPQDCYINSTSAFRNSKFSSGYDDDPFEMCSMLMTNTCEKDIGIELGLALEKSLKLCSQTNYQNSPSTGLSKNVMDLGILVNLDESPDKKMIGDAPMRDSDSVFTHTPSNPFELAWDVIEQEALTLANHIQDDKEKSISPRKMVDLAMNLSPDSMLLWPRNDVKDKAFLINNSPEFESQKTEKSKQISHSRSRYSVSSTPVITKSHATPTRSRRPSIGGMSPLTKSTKKPVMLSSSNPSIGGMSPSTKSTNKLVMPSPSNPSKGGTSPLAKSARKILLPSPAKPVVQKPTFRTPLFRSSSTTIPSHHVKPATKPVPMKAVHHGLPFTTKPPVVRSITETPVRRSIVPIIASKSPPPPSSSSTPAFLSKLRAPLTRTDSEIPRPVVTKIPDFQRQGSVRYASKRTSLNSLSNIPSSFAANFSRFAAPSRLRPTDRENLEP